MLAALSVAAALVATAAATPSPPMWGPVWTAPFFQDITILGFQWPNEVGFYYDSTTLPYGSSRSDHGEGQNDEVCTSVPGKLLSHEPCTLLDASDGWLYVLFPQSGLCCRQCSVADYCGIIAPWWLQQNTTFQGYQVIQGVNTTLWMKEGGEHNFFASTVDDAQPVQYFEGYPTFEVGNNTWNFHLVNFTRTVPVGIFDVPASMNCTQSCSSLAREGEAPVPASYAERLRLRAAAGVGGLRRVGSP